MSNLSCGAEFTQLKLYFVALNLHE